MPKRPPGFAKHPGGGPRKATWFGTIERTTRVMLGGLLPHYVAAGPTRKAEARAAVIAAARVALSDATEDDLIPPMLDNVRRRVDDGDEMDPGSLPGMFRVFFREELPEWLDPTSGAPTWRTPSGAETIMIVIQRCLDRELADRPLADDRALLGKIRTMAAFAAMGQALAPDADRSMKHAMKALGEVIDDPRQLEAAGAMFRTELDRALHAS